MLTAEQVKARDGKLTASRVGVLMSGDEAKVLSLWREMLGLEEPPDLSGIWSVRLGEATEQFHLDWVERKLGPITRRGEVVVGPKQYMAATLDGWIRERDCPIEVKHCGGRESVETIVARYMPQVTWQMMVTQRRDCALSVIMGANEPIIEFVPWCPDYVNELSIRADAFMLCVETLTPPVAVSAAEPPTLPTIEYDMSDIGAWKSLAARWQQAAGAAVIAKDCERQIKDMVPRDAKKAYGAGIVVTRNRAGSMSLRELR